MRHITCHVSSILCYNHNNDNNSDHCIMSLLATAILHEKQNSVKLLPACFTSKIDFCTHSYLNHKLQIQNYKIHSSTCHQLRLSTYSSLFCHNCAIQFLLFILKTVAYLKKVFVPLYMVN